MNDDTLFPLPPPFSPEKNPLFIQAENPVWTRNKAQLIARYLYYFVYVTKHGTYIDGFAGPQRSGFDEGWAAKLVLEGEPHRLRNFFLFDLKPNQADKLSELKDQFERNHPKANRKIRINQGDFNEAIGPFLEKHPIRDREATFCLLDQRTFQCDWSTVETIAQHKKGGHKIELFYFQPQGWLDRACSKIANREERLLRWWGDDSWRRLLELSPHDRGAFGANRFKDKLGYKYVAPFAVRKSPEDGRIMFWMIHASDHPVATTLMNRAYRLLLNPPEPLEQMEILLNDPRKPTA